MPIREKTIIEHGKDFIVLNNSATIREAFQKLKVQAYQANETYLIFSQAGGKVQVALFSDIEQAKIYGVSDDMPLNALPIPHPTRIEKQETSNYGELRDWLATHPQSTVLIVNAEGVIQGIFDNPNRGSGSNWLHQLPGAPPLGLAPGKLLRCSKCGYEYELRHIGEWPIFCPNDDSQLKPQVDDSNVS